MSDSEPNNQVPVKRGRGRPRKDPSALPAKKSSDAVSNGTKGKRGRKPGSTNKPKPANNETQGVKRGRGRPRKSESDKPAKTKKTKKAESSESDVQDNSSQEESDE